MNGFARVAISLLLLGACAVAMRFTMVSMDLPHMKGQVHSARLDTSKAKNIELDIGLNHTHYFHVRASQAGRIAGTYQATKASVLRIRDTTNSTLPKLENTTRVSFDTGSDVYTSFFWNRPMISGVSELRLPKNIPLSINLFNHQCNKCSNFTFDMRDLDVQKFNIWGTGDNNFDTLKLFMPTSKISASVQNNSGRTQLEFNRQSKGSVTVRSQNGTVVVSIPKAVPKRILIFGQAPTRLAFAQKLTLGESVNDINWEVSQIDPGGRGWYVFGKTKDATSESLSLEIQLGENARVTL